MLHEVAAELDRNGQHRIIAHNLGQVRDVLSRSPGSSIIVVPTIDDALRKLEL